MYAATVMGETLAAGGLGIAGMCIVIGRCGSSSRKAKAERGSEMGFAGGA